MQDIHVFLFQLVQAFVLLFSILNAVGNIPIVYALTQHLTENDRRRTINKSIVISFIILIVFAYAGWLIFGFLGITLNDFKIAGGILLFVVAFDRILRGHERSERRKSEAEDLAAFPLATPILAGPGSISTAIIISNTPYSPIVSFAAISLNILLALAILRNGPLFFRILGGSGMRVFGRIMGLIIAAMGVMFVREGVESIINNLSDISTNA